ncbi:MAG: sensor domain-containing diguanylate cyclase [Prochlorothrix sp.]
MLNPFVASPQSALPDLSQCPGIVTLRGYLRTLDLGAVSPQISLECLGEALQIKQMAGDWQVLLGEQEQPLPEHSRGWWARVAETDRGRLWEALHRGSPPFLVQWLNPAGCSYSLAVQTIVTSPASDPSVLPPLAKVQPAQAEGQWVFLWAMILTEPVSVSRSVAPCPIALSSAPVVLSSPAAPAALSSPSSPSSPADPGAALLCRDYQALFEYHPLPLWLLDCRNYRFLQVNGAACQEYGYGSEGFQALTLADLHLAEVWSALAKTLGRSVQDYQRGYRGASRQWVGPQRRQDGSSLTVALCWTVVPLADRLGLLMVAENISERVQAEAVLWQSHQRYESLVNSIDGIVWEFDLDRLQFTFVNRKAEEFLGYPVAQWLEEPNFWVNHVHPDDQDWVFTLCRSRSSQSESRDFEYRMISASQQVVWLRDIVTLVEGENDCSKLRGIMVNVTQQKESNALLRQYEKIVSNASDSIALLEPLADGSYVYRVVNRGYLSRFNLNYSDIVGHKVLDLLGDEFYYNTVKPYLDRCRTGETVQYETWFDHPVAGRNFLSVTYSPDQDSDGIVSSIVVSVRDLTALKQAEIALLDQAERERFLLSMMNRIRNSLSLETILATTVAEVRQMLGNDRVLVCCFFPETTESNQCTLLDEEIIDVAAVTALFRGKVVAESVVEGYPSLLNHWIQDLPPEVQVSLSVCSPMGAYSSKSDPQGCWNYLGPAMPTAPLSPQILRPDGTALPETPPALSALVLPIVTQPEGRRPATDPRLWGYLLLHHYQAPRTWRDQDLALLQQLTEQLAIAIHQSELYRSLEQANQQLSYWADHDALTHVANRRFFNRYLKQEWRRLSRDKGILSLILCDVDYFKAYNDTYGHVAGDRCLQQVAQTLASVLKRPADLVARYGGEEFVMVLPQTDLEGAIVLVQQIQARVSQLSIPHHGSLVATTLTLSFGLASASPSLQMSVRNLLKQADLALYQAKDSGRNRYAWADVMAAEDFGAAEDLGITEGADPLDDRPLEF